MKRTTVIVDATDADRIISAYTEGGWDPIHLVALDPDRILIVFEIHYLPLPKKLG